MTFPSSRSTKASSAWTLSHLGLILLSGSLFCQLAYISIAMSSSDLPLPETIVEKVTSTPKRSRALGIIQEAYKNSYRILESCPSDETEQTCFKKILLNSTSRSANDTTVEFPWWFQTMIRDGAKPRNLHASWHHMASTDPNIKMCSIEKVATTQWRKVFRSINANQNIRSQPLPPNNSPLIVFIRDPLERFLSAYIDKCLNHRHQGHCEPGGVFNDRENGLVRGLIYDKRQMFAAFVDVMPLTWNLHFFPQSLHCDGLYRHLNKYDFVGNMGREFYNDLEKAGRRYGGKFQVGMDSVFQVRDHLNRADVNVGVETKAPEHLQEYYSAQSLRRVLEYVSIDYISLGLSVPVWAEKMLAKGV